MKITLKIWINSYDENNEPGLLELGLTTSNEEIISELIDQLFEGKSITDNEKCVNNV